VIHTAVEDSRLRGLLGGLFFDNCIAVVSLESGESFHARTSVWSLPSAKKPEAAEDDKTSDAIQMDQFITGET
jgi:hypothetical protein